MYKYIILFFATVTHYHATALEQKPLFISSDLILEERLEADAIPAFILNLGQANIIARQISKEYQRSLKVFSLTSDGRYVDSVMSSIQIGKDVIFMDIGKIRDSDLEHIILFTREAAWWFNPISGKRQRFLDIQSVYLNVIKDELPHLDVVKDINGDGLDDIFLPVFNGYDLYIQTAPGIFAKPVLINVLPTMTLRNEFTAVGYKLIAANITDVNSDQKNDLVFWDPPELKAFPQLKENNFSGKHQIIPLEIKLEDTTRLAIRFGDEDQSNIQARLFNKLIDINADQKPDLITQSMTSKGVFSKSTTFEFFMGKSSTANNLSFPSQPNSKISSSGMQVSSEEKDFNNDGKTDYIIASIDLGIGMIIKALLTGSVTMDLNFYQQGENGFSEKPNIKREMAFNFSLSSGDTNSPILLIEDVNGDKKLDLVVSDEGSLEISFGDGSTKLFENNRHRFEVTIPKDTDMVDTFDLNKDGKMDIIMRYKDDNKEMRKIVKVLIAN